MAVRKGQVTDRADGVSTDPAEIVVTAEAVTGLTAVQTGLGTPGTGGDIHGATVGGTVLQPDFGVAGALVDADDATFVDPGDGTVNATDRWFPGNVQAYDYRNEAKVTKNQGGTSGAAAVGVLSLVTLPTADDTVVVGGRTYTFVATPDAVGEVAHGADAAAANTNLAAAINGDSWNDPHADVFAVASAVSVTVTAFNGGVQGNSIATTETLTDITDAWGAATLEGGTNITQAHDGIRPVGVTADMALLDGT